MPSPLSRTERLILANQYTLLLNACPPEQRMERQQLKRAIEVVEGGFEGEYSSLFYAVADDSETLSQAACIAVQETLRMHEMMQRAVRASPRNGRVSLNDCAFWGYDGHNESAQLTYLRFLLAHGDPESARELVLRSPNDPDSHAPMSARYQLMRTRWEASASQYDLTIDDVLRIIAN